METLLNLVGDTLNTVLANPWASSFISLSLAMYAGLARPTPPAALMDMMNNVFFRIFVLFMVLFMGTRDVFVSLIVASVFVYGLDAMSSEGFAVNCYTDKRGKKHCVNVPGPGSSGSQINVPAFGTAPPSQINVPSFGPTPPSSMF
jgi:hypothetical protein